MLYFLFLHHLYRLFLTFFVCIFKQKVVYKLFLVETGPATAPNRGVILHAVDKWGRGLLQEAAQGEGEGATCLEGWREKGE